MSQTADQTQINSQNLIHQALRTCNIDEIKKSVQEQKGRINERDDKLGWTPLYKAVLYGDEQIVEFLLQNGADPNIKNKLEDTPLHLCIENNYQEIFKILLQYKADPNIKGAEGMSPLHMACFTSKEQYILNLLSYGADINVKTANGTTPLHIAAESNNIRIIKALLDRNPKINSQDKEGKTAIDYCSDQNCRQILEDYESNCMNPLNESIISCQEELSNISKKLDQSSISNISTQSKKFKQMNTTQLRQNWDLKLQGLKQNIKEIKDLKKEVTKTLEEHKLKESQRSHLISQLKKKDEDDFNASSRQIFDENEKENCSSIINFIATENLPNYNNDFKQEKQQKPFFSSNYELPSLSESLEMRKEVFEARTIDKVQSDIKYNNIIIQDHNNLQRASENHNRFEIKESKTISKWLREINLESLLQNFLDNNIYDNQSLLKFLNNSNNWDKLLITLFGVDKFGHRQRIITKIHEDCGVEKRNGIFSLKYNLGGLELPTIEIWLQSLKLEQYVDLFLLTGFDDLESMMFQMTTENPITDEILFKEIGVCDHNARKKILDSLNRDAQNAQMAAVPKGFCGGFNFETSGGMNPNKCDNKCSIF